MEKVRQGKWVPLWFDEDDRLFGVNPSDYKCSLCEEIFPSKSSRWHYCPNCGAKMEKETEI